MSYLLFIVLKILELSMSLDFFDLTNVTFDVFLPGTLIVEEDCWLMLNCTYFAFYSTCIDEETSIELLLDVV